jgi:hypothetical protein
MKSIPPQPRHRISLEEADALARRDRRKLLFMGAGLVMLLGAFVFGQLYRGKYEREEEQNAPPVAAPAPQADRIFIPEFPEEELLATIEDATPDQRIVLEAPALQAVLTYSALMTEQHYAALGIEELDAQRAAELADNAGAHRMDALRTRGTVVTLKHRQRAESSFPEYYGTLDVEGAGHAHFVVIKPPQEDALAEGSFVRLDGMFFKNYNVEVGRTWIEGPLVLGRSLVRSYPAAVAGPDLATPHLDEVRDDTLEDSSGLPFEALWELLGRAKLASDEVDWDKAPTLSKEMLNQIFQDGQMHRGQPFVLPISRNMGSWVESVGENPLRLERVTTGWIGNFVWSGNVGLIQFMAPFEMPEVVDRNGAARLLAGRGYFFKNKNYEDSRGQPGRVPYFVLESLTVHTPRPDETPRFLMWLLLGGLALFIGVVTWLLARDKRESSKLQEELIRRRRARRDKANKGLTAQEP